MGLLLEFVLVVVEFEVVVEVIVEVGILGVEVYEILILDLWFIEVFLMWNICMLLKLKVDVYGESLLKIL